MQELRRRVHRDDQFLHAAHIANLPIAFLTIGMRIMTTDTRLFHDDRTGIPEGPPPIHIFKSHTWHVCGLAMPQPDERLDFVFIMGATVFTPGERMVTI